MEEEKYTEIIDFKDILTNLSKDLWFMSESDEPFEYIEFESELDIAIPLVENIAQILNQPVQNINSIEFESFFEKLTFVEDWYGESEIGTTKLYEKLASHFKETFTEKLVIEIRNPENEIEIPIYIFGITPSKKIVGLKTLKIET